MDTKTELVKATKEDAKRIFESWGYNHSNFRYLSAPPQSSIADAQIYLDQVLASSADFAFHITSGSSGETVGLIKARIEGHRALLGYVVDEPFWGRGIATSALKMMVEILRKSPNISRIWATCATDNFRSSVVLEKCGFIREGILRRWIVYPAQGPEPRDNYSYYLPYNI